VAALSNELKEKVVTTKIDKPGLGQAIEAVRVAALSRWTRLVVR